MPTIEVASSSIAPVKVMPLAQEMTVAITNLGVPLEDVTIIFRPISAGFVGGRDYPEIGFASVDITIPRREEALKRALAKTIADQLVAAGIKKETLKTVFRHITIEDVAVGDGTFPFWKEAS